MQRQSAREPRQQDRKAEILQAAAELFAEKGFAAVSIRDLAQAVHTTPAALYHHFNNKEEIYRNVLEFVFSDKARTTSELTAAKIEPEKTLRQLIAWLIRQFLDDEIMARLLARELLARDKKRLVFLTREVVGQTFADIEALMRRLAPDRDANLSAVSVLSLVLGYVELNPVLGGLTGQPVTREQDSLFAGHASQLLLHGLSPAPDAKETQ